MSSRCVKEGVTGLYARQCQGMLNTKACQEVTECVRECKSMSRNVGDANTCHIIPRYLRHVRCYGMSRCKPCFLVVLQP